MHVTSSVFSGYRNIPYRLAPGLLCIISILSSTIALAETPSWQGFYGQVATGYTYDRIKNLDGLRTVPADINHIHTPESVAFITPSQSAKAASAIISLGYNFDLSHIFTFGIGLDYSLLQERSKTFSSREVDENIIGGQQYAISKIVNLYITPGYAFSPNKTVYLKAGYSQVKLSYRAATSWNGAALADDGLEPLQNQRATIPGYLLGLGYKQIFSKKMYAFCEANYMGYQRKTVASSADLINDSRVLTLTTNPDVFSYNALLGLGYKF